MNAAQTLDPLVLKLAVRVDAGLCHAGGSLSRVRGDRRAWDMVTQTLTTLVFELAIQVDDGLCHAGNSLDRARCASGPYNMAE